MVDVPEGWSISDGEPVEAAHDAPPAAPRRRGRPPGSKNKTTRPRAPRSDRAPTARRASTKLPSLYDQLVMSYAMVGSLWALKDPVCGQAAMAAAPQIAAAWDNWAQAEPKVHAALTKMLSAGGMFAVIGAHAPLVMTVVSHHAGGRAGGGGFDPGDQDMPPAPDDLSSMVYGDFTPGSADAAR